MCLLYSAHRVKYETEINNSCFIKNKAVHTKLQSDFFRFFFKFDFHNVRILDVDSSTNKSDVLLRYCLQQTFLCNILQLRPVNGIVMMVINRCGCTMFHYVVTSKTLHIGFSFLYYKAACLFSIAHQLIIKVMVVQPRLHKSHIRSQILDIGSPLQIFQKKSIHFV